MSIMISEDDRKERLKKSICGYVELLLLPKMPKPTDMFGIILDVHNKVVEWNPETGDLRLFVNYSEHTEQYHLESVKGDIVAIEFVVSETNDINYNLEVTNVSC